MQERHTRDCDVTDYDVETRATDDKSFHILALMVLSVSFKLHVQGRTLQRGWGGGRSCATDILRLIIIIIILFFLSLQKIAYTLGD